MLLLIVTLISTALALAEQQTDMGTFAAIGATRGTRRRLAGAQAFVVGAHRRGPRDRRRARPGHRADLPADRRRAGTRRPGDGARVDPTIVIPWLPLTAVVVGVPLVAALLSAAAIRRAPALTRRAD